jgi:uncharacterized protein YjbI with pentapeptide repeats
LPAPWKLIDGYLLVPGANLTGADLTCANLTSADLSNALLGGANLTSANLTGAVLDQATTTGAVVSLVTRSGTQYPDGTNSNIDENTCAGHGF